MAVRIQLRGDTAANWTSVNPTLAQREVGLETDTNRLKIGDGTTAWNSLAYSLSSFTNLTGSPSDNAALAAATKDLIGIACSDETTVLAAASTSVPVATFHAPFACTINRVYAGLRTAGTGAAVVTVDIHKNGTTIMTTTKILFTAAVKLSADGTLTTTTLAAGDYVEIFLDQRDTDNVATGLKTYLVVTPA